MKFDEACVERNLILPNQNIHFASAITQNKFEWIQGPFLANRTLTRYCSNVSCNVPENQQFYVKFQIKIYQNMLVLRFVEYMYIYFT